MCKNLCLFYENLKKIKLVDYHRNMDKFKKKPDSSDIKFLKLLCESFMPLCKASNSSHQHYLLMHTLMDDSKPFDPLLPWYLSKKLTSKKATVKEIVHNLIFN